MTLWGIIKEDFSIIKQKDPALNSSVELFFNYPGLIALVHYRIAHRFYKAGFKILARILMGLTGFITNVDTFFRKLKNILAILNAVSIL